MMCETNRKAVRRVRAVCVSLNVQVPNDYIGEVVVRISPDNFDTTDNGCVGPDADYGFIGRDAQRHVEGPEKLDYLRGVITRQGHGVVRCRYPHRCRITAPRGGLDTIRAHRGPARQRHRTAQNCV